MGAFMVVAELRGFAPAARRLGVSPSAVTRMVAALEEHLGTRLLQRTTRSVTLTDAGARYLERTRRIVADIAEAEDAAHADKMVPHGRFAVSAPLVFGRLHVAPTMCAFLAKYPRVVGDLALSDRMVNLVEDGIDAAVRIGFLDDSSQVARTVGSTRRVLVAAPKYLKRHRKIRSVDDLAGHDAIQLSALNTTPEWRLQRDGEAIRIPYTPRYVTNSVDAALGHAMLGGGLTVALSYQVADAVAAGKLKVLLPAHEPPPLPIQIVYPTSRLLSAKVRAFIDLITRTCHWHFNDIE